MTQNIVRVRATASLISTHSVLDGRKKGEEFDCPWVIARQMEDVGKLEILKDVNAQATPEAPVVAVQKPAQPRRKR